MRNDDTFMVWAAKLAYDEARERCIIVEWKRVGFEYTSMDTARDAALAFVEAHPASRRMEWRAIVDGGEWLRPSLDTDKSVRWYPHMRQQIQANYRVTVLGPHPAEG